MTTKWRTAFAAVAVLLLAIFGSLALRRASTPPPTKSLVLPNGSRIEVFAVTYGTEHYVGSMTARLVARLPAPIKNFLHRLFKQSLQLQAERITNEPRLIVWLRTTNAPPITAQSGDYFESMLSDRSGFISGSTESIPFYSSVPYLDYKVFPRRDPIITLNIFHRSSTGGVNRCGSITVANPVHRDYPKWKPEPLPSSKSAGEVAVTLDRLVTGHNNNSKTGRRADGTLYQSYGTDRTDGRNYTRCELTLRPANTNETWKVAGEEVSDATGNACKNNSMSWAGSGSGGNAGFGFMPSLWPNEDAWRIKLEIKREKGFSAAEQFTFPSVPLGRVRSTNTINWTTNHSGLSVTFVQVVRREPRTNDSWSSDQITNIKLTHSPLPEGTHLDFVNARTDTGSNIVTSSSSSTSNERTYAFRHVPLEATTADFTFVIHKSRTVEFVTRPEIALPEPEDR